MSHILQNVSVCIHFMIFWFQRQTSGLAPCVVSLNISNGYNILCVCCVVLRMLFMVSELWPEGPPVVSPRGVYVEAKTFGQEHTAKMWGE